MRRVLDRGGSSKGHHIMCREMFSSTAFRETPPPELFASLAKLFQKLTKQGKERQALIRLMAATPRMSNIRGSGKTCRTVKYSRNCDWS